MCAAIFFPSSILTLAGGAIFSFGGIPLVWLGAVMGQTGAFFVSRYLLRGWVTKWGEKYPAWKAVDTAIRDQALKIVILIRLATLVPYSAANALLPITSLSVRLRPQNPLLSGIRVDFGQAPQRRGTRMTRACLLSHSTDGSTSVPCCAQVQLCSFFVLPTVPQATGSTDDCAREPR